MPYKSPNFHDIPEKPSKLCALNCEPNFHSIFFYFNPHRILHAGGGGFTPNSNYKVITDPSLIGSVTSELPNFLRFSLDHFLIDPQIPPVSFSPLLYVTQHNIHQNFGVKLAIKRLGC